MAAVQKPETGTAVARIVANTNVPQLIATNDLAREYIEPLLPRGVTLKQVGAQVRLALAKDKTGALAKCTVGSVILAVAKACAQNLVVGETAHLVPFGTECIMLRDYTGDIQLAVATGMCRRVSSYVVYANEPLTIKRGSKTEISHEPVQDPAKRGPMVGVYAIVHFRGGDFEAEYMTTEEVDQIRQAHSKQWKGGPAPRWYMKKTCIRQALKLIPKTAKLVELLALFDEQEHTVDADELDAHLAETPDLPPQSYRLSPPADPTEYGGTNEASWSPDSEQRSDGHIAPTVTSTTKPLTAEQQRAAHAPSPYDDGDAQGALI